MRSHPEWIEADFSSLSACTFGGNLQTYDLLESIGVPLVMAVYASTEGSFVTATMPDETDREMRKLTNGRPTSGTEVRIIDPVTGAQLPTDVGGEICFRGPFMFLGYDGETPDNTFDSTGFFHSGDYGWLDEGGRLWYRGRYKMMVKSGGENLSCKEVEIALETTCEEVVSAQVVGIPDDEWGEIAVAFLELSSGATVDPRSIRTRLRDRIAAFKAPKHFFEVAPGEWPLTLTGKVKRDELVERALHERSLHRK
jgi:fatty-acyl-CoA synthase